MITRQMHWSVVAFAVFTGAFSGCATVNPEPDYRRAAEFIQRATGIAGVSDASSERGRTTYNLLPIVQT